MYEHGVSCVQYSVYLLPVGGFGKSNRKPPNNQKVVAYHFWAVGLPLFLANQKRTTCQKWVTLTEAGARSDGHGSGLGVTSASQLNIPATLCAVPWVYSV